MKIRQLLTDASAWTQGTNARIGTYMGIGGFTVDPCSPSATCWCLNGAVLRCYPEDQVVAIQMKIQALMPADLSLVQWNDMAARKFEDIKALVENLDI